MGHEPWLSGRRRGGGYEGRCLQYFRRDRFLQRVVEQITEQKAIGLAEMTVEVAWSVRRTDRRWDCASDFERVRRDGGLVPKTESSSELPTRSRKHPSRRWSRNSRRSSLFSEDRIQTEC